MRLNSFLNEEYEIYKNMNVILDNIKKDCKPFLNNIKSEHDLLLRGVYEKVKGDGFKTKPLKNRKPLNTPKNLHKYLDSLFNDAFNIKIRSEGVFSTYSFSLAKDYGHVYIIIPKGDYNLFYSEKITDLFVSLDLSDIVFNIDNKKEILSLLYIYHRDFSKDFNSFKAILEKDFLRYYNEEEFILLIKELEKLQYKDIVKIIKALYNKTKYINPNTIEYDTEIMIQCDEYYAIYIEDENEIPNIYRHLKG